MKETNLYGFIGEENTSPPPKVKSKIKKYPDPIDNSPCDTCFKVKR